MAGWKVYENPKNGRRTRVKDGYNWVVFGFGPIWYLFNGLIGTALAWLAAALFVGLFTFGYGGIIVWIISGFWANKTKERQLLKKGWQYIGDS